MAIWLIAGDFVHWRGPSEPVSASVVPAAVGAMPPSETSHPRVTPARRVRARASPPGRMAPLAPVLEAITPANPDAEPEMTAQTLPPVVVALDTPAQGRLPLTLPDGPRVRM